MSTVRIGKIVFLLQVILVSVGVKCACIEDDCTGQAIIVVNPSSGECVSCFPCPQCEEGQTPSVPCASTVPQGQDIHCVPIAPSPSAISTSVLSWHKSITGTSRQQITATVHTYDHPSVSANSKDYAGSSSPNSKENTGSTIIPENHSNMGSRTVVYLLCGIFPLFIFLGIFWKLRKSKTMRSHHVIENDTMASSPPTSMTGATPVDYSIHAVRLHPENSSSFQPQHNQTLHEENGIPPSLDDDNAQGLVPAYPELPDAAGIDLDVEGDELCSPTEDHSPAHDDLTHSSNHPAAVLFSDSHEFQKHLLTRKLEFIPLLPFYRKICNKLDVQRPLWDDYRMFGDKIGLSRDEISLLGQRGQPTHSMLQKFDSQMNSSIGKFKKIMEDMDRHDVVTIINEWISYEWGKLNSLAAPLA